MAILSDPDSAGLTDSDSEQAVEDSAFSKMHAKIAATIYFLVAVVGVATAYLVMRSLNSDCDNDNDSDERVVEFSVGTTLHLPDKTVINATFVAVAQCLCRDMLNKNITALFGIYSVSSVYFQLMCYKLLGENATNFTQLTACTDRYVKDVHKEITVACKRSFLGRVVRHWTKNIIPTDLVVNVRPASCGF